MSCTRRFKRALAGQPLWLAEFVRHLLIGVIVNRPGCSASHVMRAHSHPHSRSAPARRMAYALALAGLVMLGACHQQQAAAPVPRPVVVATAHADGSPLSASLPGEVQARYSTPLSFRIAGKIIERIRRRPREAPRL